MCQNTVRIGIGGVEKKRIIICSLCIYAKNKTFLVYQWLLEDGLEKTKKKKKAMIKSKSKKMVGKGCGRGGEVGGERGEASIEMFV